MRSSNIACVVFIAVIASANVCPAQTDNRAEAIEFYNEATRLEHEGLTTRDGGAGTLLMSRYAQECLVLAVRSYRLYASKLAAWRVVSCATELHAWPVAYLGRAAFNGLEPRGIESWAHPSIPDAELARVRRQAASIETRVGILSLRGLPETAVQWVHPRESPRVESGHLPGVGDLGTVSAARAATFSIDAGIVMTAGSTARVLVHTGDPGGRAVSVRIRPLHDGVTAFDAAQLAPPAPSRPQPRAGSGPPAPSRSDVMNALRAVAPGVRACGPATARRVTVSVTFEGATGHVWEAATQAQIPENVRTCVLNAVGQARVGTFSEPTFRTSYPFSL